MSNDFIMKPTVDFCFKELMSDKKVRQGFISALLDMPPEEIADTNLLPTILPGEHADDKLGILDVLVSLRDGTQMDLEMQVIYFESWAERTLFYLGKMLTNQLHKGDPYSKMKKCIHVSILNFKLFPDDEKQYSRFHIWEDDRHIKYSDKLELHILELPKLKNFILSHGSQPPRTGSTATHDEQNNPSAKLLQWARFFAAENEEEFKMITKGDEYLETAYDDLINLSADERKQLEYETRMKALRDYNSFMEYAENKGIRQGRQEAHREDLLELLGELGDIPNELKDQISQEKCPETLKKWLKLAARADSISEFREKMI